MKKSIIYISLLNLFLSHDVEYSPSWKQYYRGSYIFNEDSGYGLGGYCRFKRTTKHTFKDLRVFLHFTEEDSYKKIRYKDSSRFRELYNFYNYTTISIDQNTKVGVDIRYHGNQGIGMFLKDFDNGHINSEVALAYDISDYLNDSRKTSYFKSGIYWDQDFSAYEVKLEIENFYQISDIVNDKNLSRLEVLFELYYPINDGWRVILGYEHENFRSSDNTSNSSVYLSIGYSDFFNFPDLKNIFFD